MSVPYVYQEHLPRDSIRLLKLISDGVTFHGELERFNNHNVPYYAPVSWCWTSRKETGLTFFTCDNKHFPISSHLFEFLDSILPKGAPASMTIWIDAICINQDHIEEKNVHVPRMHEIYNGKLVLAYLGPSSEESELVISNTPKIKDMIAKMATLPDYGSPENIEQYGLPPSTDPIWQAIGELLDLDWFYRTWIVQEVAMAGSIQVLCGRKWIDWELLETLASDLSRTGLSIFCKPPTSEHHVSGRPNGIGVLLDLCYTRGMMRISNCSIDYLLRMVRLKEVSKPVDKIYGLLGLLGEDVRNTIVVDYRENEKKYWNAYIEVAKYVLRNNSQAFWLLSMASSRQRPSELPSWCPNFASDIPEKLDFSHQNWRAGKMREDSQIHGISIVEDTNYIKVAGFVVDEVARVVNLGSPPSPSSGQDNQSAQRFESKSRECEALANQLYDDPREALTAYALSLVVNTSADGSPITTPKQIYDTWKAYRSGITYLSKSEGYETSSTSSNPNMQRYLRQLGWWAERPFYTTKNGKIGRGPTNIREGDLVCVLYGAGPLFVLRSTELGGEDYMSAGAMKLVGDAYLHGCVDLAKLPAASKGIEREFVIV